MPVNFHRHFYFDTFADMETHVFGYIIVLLIGGVLGIFLAFFLFVKRSKYEAILMELNTNKPKLEALEKEIARLSQENQEGVLQYKTLQHQLEETQKSSISFEKEKDFLAQILKSKEEEIIIQKKQIQQFALELTEKGNEISTLSAINSSLQEKLQTQKEEIIGLQNEMKLHFENLATKIFEDKREKLAHLNKEQIGEILKPLGENLNDFRKKVDEVYQNEARERHSLNTTIKLMMEQAQVMTAQANNLATALKGQSKIQGDWGEMILERILESSGLVEGREFHKQLNFKNESDENIRPDFVLQLPGDQLVMIDSKVSLNAYDRMVAEEDTEQQKEFLKLHIAAMKKHVDTLSDKRYDAQQNAVDFTIMFVPIEPAFLLAMQHESQLWNYAYKKNIIILSPTNLIAYLKLISDVWKREHYNQNAIEIADRGAKLYDKFVLFVENLNQVGKKLDDAKTTYQNAYKQLYTGKDNLVIQTQKLKKLGANAQKEIPKSMLDLAENESPDNE